MSTHRLHLRRRRLYALSDNNHNVTAITDVFGNVKEHFIYDPYGTPTVLNSSWTSTSDSYAWAVLFQGKRFDTTIQTYDFDHRMYKPSLGSFIQADPLGYPDGTSRYSIEMDLPTFHWDPQGLNVADDGSAARKARIDEVNRRIAALELEMQRDSAFYDAQRKALLDAQARVTRLSQNLSTVFGEFLGNQISQLLGLDSLGDQIHNDLFDNFSFHVQYQSSLEDELNKNKALLRSLQPSPTPSHGPVSVNQRPMSWNS